MSTIDTEALRALAGAATPGPWVLASVMHETNEAVGIAFVQSPTGWPAQCLHSRDAVFIAAARTAVPALLDALAERDAEVARLTSGAAWFAEQTVTQAFPQDDFPCCSTGGDCPAGAE